ncbi:MAG TPA: hypothetical protein VGK29_06725 [Paludibaculum sp.]|jgi:hypothetical protein
MCASNIRFLALYFWIVAVVSATTHSVSFGDAGSLVVESQVTTKKKLGMFQNIVFGTLTNTTKAPLFCLSIEAVVPGPLTLPPSLYAIKIPAGQSVPFEKDDVISSTNLSAIGIQGWRAECRVNVVYSFVAASVKKKFSAGVAHATIGLSQVALTVENDSEDVIELAWNDSSFIDLERSAKRVFHAGVKYTDREQTLPNTVIPPMAKAEDAVIPTSNVYFSEGQYGGWRETSLLPSDLDPQRAGKAMAEMKGKKVAVFLQILIRGKKEPVTLMFEIVDVRFQE